MPKISVIIPIYRVEKYIATCAHSLFRQTLKDIEYIFIDDCTPDNSIRILKEVLLEYPHRKDQTQIVKMPKNSGLPAVRRHGIQLASGEYITTCDSDDWITHDTYKQMYESATKNNADIVFCDFNFYNENECRHKLGDFGDLNNKESVLRHVVDKQQWQLCRAIIKRSLFINNNITYPKANNGEDFALTLQLLCYANKFAHIPLPLYYYRYNPDSITNNVSEQSYLNRLEQHKQNVILVEDFFPKIESVSLEVKKHILTILKLNARYLISYLAHKKKYKKIWYNTFPELEKERILLNMAIPYNLQKNYFATKLNIYNFLRKCKKCLVKRKQ